jgi:hypothetical protein
MRTPPSFFFVKLKLRRFVHGATANGASSHLNFPGVFAVTAPVTFQDDEFLAFETFKFFVHTGFHISSLLESSQTN